MKHIEQRLLMIIRLYSSVTITHGDTGIITNKGNFMAAL